MLIIKAAGIFILSCAANAVWAYTIRSIGEGNAFRAAASSGLLGLVSPAELWAHNKTIANHYFCKQYNWPHFYICE